MRTHTHTHTKHISSSIANLTASWYFIKIKYSEPNISAAASVQGRAETFGGAGAQSIKGAHGTQLLIGLCCLLICASKWMLLY